MTNYWPISLLALFCKVSEKAMHCRLSQHMPTKAYWSQNNMVLESVNQKMHVG